MCIGRALVQARVTVQSLCSPSHLSRDPTKLLGSSRLFSFLSFWKSLEKAGHSEKDTPHAQAQSAQRSAFGLLWKDDFRSKAFVLFPV